MTSSKEAARLLLQEESESPQSLGDKQLGDEQGLGDAAGPGAAEAGNGPAWIIGAILMVMTLAILALFAALPGPQTGTSDTPPPAVMASDAEKEDVAREWLALTDAGEWRASYDATGSTFQELNTPEVWESVSLEARAPLGAATRRETIGIERVNAPPFGYWQVRFSTDFAQRTGVVETVTLEREDGQLRVVGYIIE